MSDYISDSKSSSSVQENHTIEYTGTAGKLFPIVLLNLFLTIITLGIYRFWAKTNIRKYMWGETKFDGEPFEYTGTGGELFVGALIVFVAFIIPLSVGLTFLLMSYPVIAPFIVLGLYPFLIFLMGVAIYRAQMYRMSRTNWRGIRGAQLKGSSTYGWLTLKYIVLYLITFGLIAPYIICRLWNFLMNNKRFGSGVMSSDAKSKPLFKIWILTWLASIIVFGGIMFLLITALTTNDIGMILFSYLLLFIASVVISVWFQAALYNHLISSLSYQNMKFDFNVSVGKFLTFSIVNMLILIFTLGLGAPFIMQRWTRFFCEEITFTGQIDFAEIDQSPETGPEFGEGLVEAFDMG